MTIKLKTKYIWWKCYFSMFCLKLPSWSTSYKQVCKIHHKTWREYNKEWKIGKIFHCFRLKPSQPDPGVENRSPLWKQNYWQIGLDNPPSLGTLSRMWYSWTFITNLERIFIHTTRTVRCLAELNTQESWREAYRYQKYSHNNISVYYVSNPVCCSNLFPRHQDLHQHNTRNTSNCVILALHFITVFNWLKTDNVNIVKWYLDRIWIR